MVWTLMNIQYYLTSKAYYNLNFLQIVVEIYKLKQKTFAKLNMLSINSKFKLKYMQKWQLITPI